MAAREARLKAALAVLSTIVRPGAEHRVDGSVRRLVARALDEATLKPVVAYLMEGTGQTILAEPVDWLRSHDPVAVQEPRGRYKERPRPGSRWQHHKGGKYRVVATGVHVRSGRLYVVYKAEEAGHVWARRLESWLESVEVGGRRVKRFASIPG